MGEVTKKVGKAIKATAKSSADVVGDNAKKAIKDMARQKLILKAIGSDDVNETMLAIGKTGVQFFVQVGAAMIKITARAVLEICRLLVSIFGIYSLFIFVPVILVFCCVGGESSSKTTEIDYSISGGAYQYVSYSQTKYEAMYVDEDGNQEDGWCGVTAYADALASAGCKNKSGEPITPYDVRSDADCTSQYVSVGGWCAKFASKNFPDVKYVYTLGYTKDWVDEKLSEGMMVGIYLSSRAQWKENYTGKTGVTSSAHWILIVGKASNTEYICLNPADGSGDDRYIEAANAEYGSVGTLTIDLSGLTESVPSASSKDIRIHAGDSAGSADGKPRGSSYCPPAFAIGTEEGAASDDNDVSDDSAASEDNHL